MRRRPSPATDAARTDENPMRRILSAHNRSAERTKDAQGRRPPAVLEVQTDGNTDLLVPGSPNTPTYIIKTNMTA